MTGREEFAAALDEEGNSWPEPDWPALFHGRRVAAGSRIGVRSGKDKLVIEEHYAGLEEASRVIQLHGPRVVIKLQDSRQPVPIKSLGDGATRVFGVALALANSKNGLLLIDEAENDVHHSVQRDFWHMVQVLATTHSWDVSRALPKRR